MNPRDGLQRWWFQGPVLLNPLVFRGKGYSKRSLKTGSDVITYILNEEPEQRVGDIFKTRFREAKGSLEEKD
jgi:hypothetical protein